MKTIINEIKTNKMTNNEMLMVANAIIEKMGNELEDRQLTHSEIESIEMIISGIKSTITWHKTEYDQSVSFCFDGEDGVLDEIENYPTWEIAREKAKKHILENDIKNRMSYLLYQDELCNAERLYKNENGYSWNESSQA